MTASVVQLSISPGGLPKRAITECWIATLGLDGDRHNHPGIHGGPLKAVLLASAEIIDDLAARGYPLFYGALGENITTRGLDVRQLRIGTRIRMGGATLEITQPRGPCSALDIYGENLKYEIYDQQVKQRDPLSPRWGMSGLYASVAEPGPVRTGDPVTVLSHLA
jgi:MOSC domain-containing protein YiiM